MKKLIRSCKENYVYLFSGSIMVSIAIYLLITLFSGGLTWNSIFYDHTNDSFMDFFNSLRDASLGGAAYTERQIIYPPMANLFFWILSFITPDAYNSSDFLTERYTWVNYPINIALIIIFLLISTVFFALLVYHGLNLPQKQRVILTIVTVFSVPFLTMLERGNIMTFAFIALLFFAITYNSKSRLLRELGLIAIAYSFSIKLYPLLFAWILIGDKRYREFARCAIYSLAFLVLPSFAFGGPQCLLTMIKNIIGFSSGNYNVLFIVHKYGHIPYGLVAAVAYTWFALTFVNFLVSPFIYRERWKVWAAGCITFISFPSLCSTYAWALFIIPIIFLCNDELHKNWKQQKRQSAYLVCMLIPFLLFAVKMPEWMPVTANQIVVHIVIIIISAYAMYDTVRTAVEQLKKQKALQK